VDVTSVQIVDATSPKPYTVQEFSITLTKLNLLSSSWPRLRRT